MTDLPGVFGTVAPYIEDYGYFAVAALVFIANLGIPVPGDASLVVAAIFTVSEDLSLVPVLIVGWTAAVLGECAAYAIGRYGGRPLAIRLGRRFGVTHDLLDRVEGFYRHHGVKTVIIGRFIPLLRRVNGLVAGVTAMSWRRFLVANMFGAAVWVGVAATVGIQAGNNIDTVNTVLERGAPIIGLAFLLLLVAAVIRRRRRRRTATTGTDSPVVAPDVTSPGEHR